jgi:hypothetical protein
MAHPFVSFSRIDERCLLGKIGEIVERRSKEGRLVSFLLRQLHLSIWWVKGTTRAGRVSQQRSATRPTSQHQAFHTMSRMEEHERPRCVRERMLKHGSQHDLDV